MHLELEAMALEMPAVVGHPNRLPFAGVLTMIDEPSDKPPSGARGHRVLLTAAATEKALPSLLGMGLDYAPSLDRHDARRKIGVITAADVRGELSRQLHVEGYVYAQDFPEVVRDIEANTGKLGMSYEIADASVEDIHAPVWTVCEFTFTGAAVLRRDKAAYRKTSIGLKAGAGTRHGSQADTSEL